MITDEELTDRLARSVSPTPGPARPLTEIEARARAIRRTVRARRAGALTVLAGGLGVGLVVVRGVPGGSSTGAVTPGRSTATPTSSPAPGYCNGGYADMRTFADVPDLLYLPSASAAGQPLLSPALVRRDRANCPPAPMQGVWYGMTAGAVARILTISGPKATDPYDLGDGGTFMGTTTKVRVRGGDGVLYAISGGTARSATLFWHEPGAGSWLAEASGIEGTALLSAVESLKIDGDRLTVRPLPGLTSAVQPKASEYAAAVTWALHLTFGNVNEDQGGWGITIRRGEGPFVPLPGAERIAQNGRVYWWWGGAGAKGNMLSWNGPEGVRFTVRGVIDRAKALAVAESLVHVRPDDPRLLAVKETPAPATSATPTGATPTGGSTTVEGGPTAGGSPTNAVANATPTK